MFNLNNAGYRNHFTKHLVCQTSKALLFPILQIHYFQESRFSIWSRKVKWVETSTALNFMSNSSDILQVHKKQIQTKIYNDGFYRIARLNFVFTWNGQLETVGCCLSQKHEYSELSLSLRKGTWYMLLIRKKWAHIKRVSSIIFAKRKIYSDGCRLMEVNYQ